MKFLPENKKLRAFLICLAGGALLGLSFPPFHTWFFVYFGLVILLYLLFSSASLKQAFRRGYLTLLIFNMITIYWISGWHSSDLFLKIGGAATVLIHPLLFMIPVLTIYGISRVNKLSALILFPFIWVGFEYFHNLWQLTFPWLELGNTESYNLLRIQYIEYVGVHGVSFIICCISSLLYYVIEKIAARKWKIFSKGAVVCYLILLILFLFPNFYSYHRLKEDNSRYFQTSDSSKIINICIVQSNTDPFEKWSSNHEVLIDSYISRLNQGLKFNPDMLILHETATPYYFLEDYNGLKTKKFLDFADSSGKYLLMGIPHLEYYKDSTQAPSGSRKMSTSGRYYDTYNSAILIEHNKYKKELTIHKKAKLVPFSERIPYQEYLPFLKKWFSWGVGISSWQRGDKLTIFSLSSKMLNVESKFATLICFESVFSDYVSEAAKNGAEFLVIVTNDGWFGHTAGPIQHKQYAVLRAIENRKWIARCAQTGVSCYIDPLGNIYDEVPYGTEGIIDRNIIANNEKTFYAEHGDIIGRVSYYAGILCMVFCAAMYFNNKLRKRKN